MAADFVVENPGDIDFTLTQTFTLAEWKTIRKSLMAGGYSYPTEKFKGDIIDMVCQAEKLYYPEQEKESG